jgi:hypothetical protein
MTNLVIQVKPSQTSLALETMIRARVPTFLWGPPGVGKSQLVHQTANKLGRQVIDIRAVQFDPVDLRGIPVVNGDGMTHWSVPDILPRWDRDGIEGILFLDELNAAPQAVQAALYQLVLDRRLGEYVLPTGWDVIAAGNREGDRGVTNRMPTPLANRFGHYEVVPDVPDWVRWALSAGLRAEVIAFIRFRPELLHAFDARSGEKAFPTPRSWEFVHRLLEADPDPEIEFPAYASVVGQGAAGEFTAFLRIFRRLPTVDSILLAPATADVPDDPSTIFALAGALVRRADSNNIERIWTYVKRLPAEFTVLIMSDCCGRNPDLKHTRAFIEFGSEYSEVVL